MSNHLKSGRSCSVPKGLLLGALVSVLTTMIAAALVAKLIDVGKIPWECVGYGTMILLFLSAFLGAITANYAIKRQRLIISLMSGIVYFGILLSATALFFGGQFEAVGVTALLVLAGCGSAGLLVFEGKRGGNRRKTKKAYC